MIQKKIDNGYYEHWMPESAYWIWDEGETHPCNAYVQFRKTFLLSVVPEEAVIHISADCRYILYVNGTVVGRGPVTTAPEYKQVDVYNIGKFLNAEDNVIAVMVLHRQNKTSRLIPVRGGLILKFDSSTLSFGTDGGWKCRRAIEYKEDTPYMTHQYGNQEWVDGRKAAIGWQWADYDDTAWSSAVVVNNSVDYWPDSLEVRTVPHMRYRIVYPKQVISYFGLSMRGKPESDDSEPAKEIMLAYPMSSIRVWNVDNIVHPENGPAILEEAHGDGVGIVVDLGKEMLGYPFIDVECPAGVTINIGHGEILSRNRLQTVLMPESVAEQRYAERYITREGRQRFEIFDTKGCRYLEIHFNRLADFYTGAKIIIHAVGMIKSESPVIDVASKFSCDDPVLNRIWGICRETAFVKCQDWHICDAQREQNNWPEIIQDMLYYQIFGKVEVVRQMIQQFCRHQLDGGFIRSTFPSVRKNLNETTEEDLFIYSTIFFPSIVWLDWLYGGEDIRQSYWLECCCKVFDALKKYQTEDGIISNLPGDPFVEWTGLDSRRTGRDAKSTKITAFNCITIVNLELLSEMAEYYGYDCWSTEWRSTAESLRKNSGALFWNDDRQSYIDGVYDGEPSRIVSQTSNAWAVLARLGSKPRLKKAIEIVESPTECDVSSGISMMGIYHQALQSLSLDSPVQKKIKRIWGYMLDHDATTTWEGTNALEANMGLCFGFAGHPLNYLAQTALGVIPVAPGYKEFSVRIVPFDLNNTEGKIVTPYGYIEISWRKTDDRITMRLIVPPGTKAYVVGNLGDSEKQFIIENVNRENIKPELIASCTFVREYLPAYTLDAGEHSISFHQINRMNVEKY